MRKLEKRDLWALSLPMLGSMVAGTVVGHEKDLIAGILSAVAMLIFTFWRWRRQIIKHPVGTWRARI